MNFLDQIGLKHIWDKIKSKYAEDRKQTDAKIQSVQNVLSNSLAELGSSNSEEIDAVKNMRASSTQFGMVKIGQNITVVQPNEDQYIQDGQELPVQSEYGTISVNTANQDTLGVVKGGGQDNVKIDNGIIILPKASKQVGGIVKFGDNMAYFPDIESGNIFYGNQTIYRQIAMHNIKTNPQTGSKTVDQSFGGKVTTYSGASINSYIDSVSLPAGIWDIQCSAYFDADYQGYYRYINIYIVAQGESLPFPATKISTSSSDLEIANYLTHLQQRVGSGEKNYANGYGLSGGRILDLSSSPNGKQVYFYIITSLVKMADHPIGMTFKYKITKLYNNTLNQFAQMNWFEQMLQSRNPSIALYDTNYATKLQKNFNFNYQQGIYYENNNTYINIKNNGAINVALTAQSSTGVRGRVIEISELSLQKLLQLYRYIIDEENQVYGWRDALQFVVSNTNSDNKLYVSFVVSNENLTNKQEKYFYQYSDNSTKPTLQPSLKIPIIQNVFNAISVESIADSTGIKNIYSNMIPIPKKDGPETITLPIGDILSYYNDLKNDDDSLDFSGYKLYLVFGIGLISKPSSSTKYQTDIEAINLVNTNPD